MASSLPRSVGAAVARGTHRRRVSASLHRCVMSAVKPASKLSRVELGSQGLRVSAQGLGCMGLGSFYCSSPQSTSSGVTEDEGLALLRAAADADVIFWDTAQLCAWSPTNVYTAFLLGQPSGAIYSFPDCKLDKASGATIYNEALLGKALRDVGRENVVIATKSGITYDPKTFKGGVDGSPQFLKRSCAESLERLGVDSVDLFYLHRPDPKVPIEESVSALADLQREGKVEHIGISNVTAEQIRRAHAVAPISAVQMEWSLWSRGIEKEA